MFIIDYRSFSKSKPGRHHLEVGFDKADLWQEFLENEISFVGEGLESRYRELLKSYYDVRAECLVPSAMRAKETVFACQRYFGAPSFGTVRFDEEWMYLVSPKKPLFQSGVG
jgi:hypothetical protein